MGRDKYNESGRRGSGMREKEREREQERGRIGERACGIGGRDR